MALILSSLAMFAKQGFSQANFNSAATGNWNAAATWTLVSGADADGIPDANDNASILSPHAISLTGAAAAANVSVDLGGILNTNANTLTASGAFALNGIWSGTGTITLTGAGTSISGTGSSTGSSTLSITTGAKSILAGTNLSFAGAIAITGAIVVTNNGTVGVAGNITGSVAGSTWTNAANATLDIGGALLAAGTLTATANPNTVNYNGTAAVNQTVKGTTYHDLTVTRGVSNAAIVTAAITLNGNLSIASGTLDLRGANVTVNGTTNVSATLTFTTSAAGAKLFAGAVIVNPGGTWDASPSNEGSTLRGGLTNDGTFISGTGTYAFNTNSQALGGSNGLSFGGIVSIVGAITVTNTTSVVIAGNLTGSVAGSTWLNASGSSLDLRAAAMVTGVLNASANPNTVRYASTVAGQTVKAATYDRLEIDKSAQAATINAATTVNGELTVISGTLILTGATTLNGNAVVASAGTLNPRGINLTVNGTTSVDGTLSFTNSVAGTKTFVGGVTINPGGTWTNAINEGVTFNGGLTHNGTAFASGTGIYTFNTNGQSIGGSTPFSIANVTVALITLTNTGNLTVTASLNGTGEVANGAGATLTIGFTGALGVATLTASAGGNTVIYDAAGAQAIEVPSGSVYHHLTLSTSGAKTAGGSLTINGDLTIDGNATFNAGTSLAHSFLGSWVVNTLAATPFSFTTASTLNFETPATPAGTSISGSSTATLDFNSVNLNNTSGFLLAENVTASGTLTVAAGVTLTPLDAVTIGGSGTLTGSGTVKVTRTTTTPDFISQYTIAGLTLTDLTVDYDAATAQTINALNYFNLTISNNRGSGDVTLAAGTIGVSGTFNPLAIFTTGGYATTGNTIDYNGSSGQTVTLFGYNSLTLSNAGVKVFLNGTTGIAGSLGVTGTASADATSNNTTIHYNGGLAQTVGSITYWNLLFSNAGVKTFTGDALITGTVTINSGSPVTIDPSVSVQVDGDFTNDGFFTNNGTITLGTE